MSNISFSYDSASDVGYVRLSDEHIINSKESTNDEEVILNYNSKGDVVGFQIIGFAEFVFSLTSLYCQNDIGDDDEA